MGSQKGRFLTFLDQNFSKKMEKSFPRHLQALDGSVERSPADSSYSAYIGGILVEIHAVAALFCIDIGLSDLVNVTLEPFLGLRFIVIFFCQSS